MHIPHKVILQVVDYDKKTTHYYRVTSYKLLEGLLRMPSTNQRINIADKAMEQKLRVEMRAFWEHGMRETEDYNKADALYILELGLCKE